jgi:hypothetical protein
MRHRPHPLPASSTCAALQPRFSLPVTDFRIELGALPDALEPAQDVDKVLAKAHRSGKESDSQVEAKMAAAVKQFEQDANVPAGSLVQVRFVTFAGRSKWESFTKVLERLTLTIKQKVEALGAAVALLWDADAKVGSPESNVVRMTADNLNAGTSRPAIYAYIQRGNMAPLTDVTVVPFFIQKGGLDRYTTWGQQLTTEWEKQSFGSFSSYASREMDSVDTVPPSPHCANKLLLLTRGTISTRPPFTGVKQYAGSLMTSIYTLNAGWW